MVNDRPAVCVEDNPIVIDRLSGYRNTPGQVWGIPI